MAAITTGGSGNWDDADGAGAWTGTTQPVAGDSVIVADGHVLALNANASILSLTAAGNTGYCTCAANVTLTITGTGVAYGGTLAAGFIRVTANTLTITSTQGGATVLVTASSTGHAVRTSSTGSVVASNSGGWACLGTSSGSAVYHGSSGTGTTITGIVEGRNVSGAGFIAFQATGACTINGNAYGNGGRAIYIFQSSATWAGNPIVSNGKGIALHHWSTGTTTWSSAATRTVGAGEYAVISCDSGGTIDMSNVTLEVSGALTILNAGTVTTTNASIKLMSASAQVAGIGLALPVTGASIPSAANTRYGATRGWPGGSIDATAGGGVAGGNGLLEIPNEAAPTGTQDATSDGLVKDGAKYGSPQRTGTLAAGGGGGGFIQGSSGRFGVQES